MSSSVLVSASDRVDAIMSNRLVGVFLNLLSLLFRFLRLITRSFFVESVAVVPSLMILSSVVITILPFCLFGCRFVLDFLPVMV